MIQGGVTFAAMALPVRESSSGPLDVDLALVLAVDISRSITKDEHREQLDGYAAAFRSGAVLGAIASGANGVIAVTLLEWAATAKTIQAVGWTLIRNGASAERFAASIEAVPYTPKKGTSIGCMHVIGEMAFTADRLLRSALAGPLH